MEIQLLLILAAIAALSFVVMVTAVGLIVNKATSERRRLKQERVYTHYSNQFAEILLKDLLPLPAGSPASALFRQYESLIVPIKKEFVGMTPSSYKLHREMLRHVLIDFAKDLTGKASERLVYYFYSLQFIDEQVALLRDRRWWIRAQAARDIGILKTRRGLAALTSAMGDRHPEVREQARKAVVSLAGVDALHTILRTAQRISGWAALELSTAVMSHKEEAVPYLIEALSYKDLTVVMFAIDMLAEVGFVDAVEPLMEVARTSQNMLVRAEAIMALGRLGDGRAEQLLVEHIESPQPLLRVRAIEALARIGSPGAVPMLQKRLMEGTFAEQLGSARAIAASGAEAVNQLREIAEQGTGMPQAICKQVLEEVG